MKISFTQRIYNAMLIKYGGYAALPLNISKQRDTESLGFGGYPPDNESEISSFTRKLSSQEQLMLWRLHNGSLSPAHLFENDGRHITSGEGGEYVSWYKYTVVAALCARGWPMRIRFKHSQSDSNSCSAPDKPIVHAIEFGRKEIYESRTIYSPPRVFELNGPHINYWRSPEMAIKTMITMDEWWRPWTALDEEAAMTARQAHMSSN
ncbi:MAG: hypothetical protein QM808_10680 [Steroidobacteraceae bacterium]